MKIKNFISWKLFTKKSALFYLVILIVAVGCGTRNTGKTYHEFKADSLRINNNIVLTQDKRFNDVFSIEPKDNTKPIIINGVAYYNSVLKYDKSIVNKVEYKDLSKLSYDSSETIKKEKTTHREDNSNLWVGIVFVILMFLWAYLKL